MFARKPIRRVALLLAVLSLLAAGGCGGNGATPADEPAESPVETVSGDAADASAPLVMFLGDSLTAGAGLPADSGYPAVIERTLRAEGHPVRVVNAGVSGDTSAGGLSRLPWLIKQEPDVLVVALGGNDGLRGLPLASTRKNLSEIVTTAQAQGVAVLLLGLKMPPNYGPEYTAEFEHVYAELAEERRVPLVPYMLEGVGGIPRLNQGDGIHPTAEGQKLVAANVLPALRELLEAER